MTRSIRLPQIAARTVCAFGVVLLAGPLAGCAGFSPTSVSRIVQGDSVPQDAAERDATAAWRSSLTGIPLPRVGCFEASYPSLRWQHIACSKPPRVPASFPRGVRRPGYVGDGNDYTIETRSNMSMAIGSFPNVSGVERLSSAGGYTLQLNSSFFPTAACNGESNCLGWEQFVYEDSPGSSTGEAFIQDWLVRKNAKEKFSCPPNAGWTFAGVGCVQNSPSGIDVPNTSVRNLADLVLTGAAASSGDGVYLAVGSKVYGMKNLQKDGITDLASHWTGAEFNVVGPGNDATARFNSGSTITVSVQAVTGDATAPACVADSGTTGETNNLELVRAPSNPKRLRYPSILFTESNAPGGGSASCDAVPGT